MCRFLFVLLTMSFMGIPGLQVDAQQLKKKPDPKAKKKDDKDPEPKKFEFPTEIGGKKVEYWVNEVKHSKDPSMRDLALKTIPNFGPKVRPLISKTLIHVLRTDPDINVRLTAINMVPVIGFESEDMKEGMSLLYRYLDPSYITTSHARNEALMALGRCGPVAKDMIPKIISYPLKDTTSFLNRKAAVFALGRIGMGTPKPKKSESDPDELGPPDSRCILALCKSLQYDVSHEVRREAVDSLLILGPPSEEKVWKELRKTLDAVIRDKNEIDPTVTLWARVVMIRSSTEKASISDPNLIAIANMVDDKKDFSMRLEALKALAILGNEAKSRVPQLLAYAEDPLIAKINEKTEVESELRDGIERITLATMALTALAQMTDELNMLLPHLDKLKRHEKEPIKKAAEAAYQALTKRKDDPLERQEKKN